METIDAQRGQVVLEELSDLQVRPFDLNRVGWRELARLPGINALTARQIVEYRQNVQGFASLSEITSVEGVDRSTFTAVRPYLTLSPPDSTSMGADPVRGQPVSETSWTEALKDVDLRFSQLWSRRLDVGTGYTRDTSRSHYIGDPSRHATRLTLWLGDRVRAAGVFEKDPGEAWAWDTAERSFGYDHAAGSLQIRGIGPIDHLVLGDYTVSLGQGVGVWSGFAFGKGRDATGGIVRDRQGIRPFASTEENRFFRGIATELHAGDHLTFGGFASRRAVDARLEQDPQTGEWDVTSLPSSGLHRTESERDTRDALRESVLGGMIEVASRRLEVGVAGLYATTASPLRPGERPHEVFDTAGRKVGVLTGYGTWFPNRVRVAAEVARLHRLDAPGHGSPTSIPASSESSSSPGPFLPSDVADGAWGGVVSLTYADDRRSEAVVAGRFYGKSFDNRFGAGFSETNPHNEAGLYAGLQLGVAPHWTISGYIDTYRSDWLRYQAYRPTIGREVRLLIEYEPRPWLSQYFQYRSETKERDAGRQTGASEPGYLRTVAPETRWSLRWNAEYQFSDQVTLRSRIEYVRSTPAVAQPGSETETTAPPPSSPPTDSVDPTSGILIAQDVDWTPHPKLRISGRLAHFDTRSFDARVFAYERDVLYSFRVPALSGRGERSYVLVRWSVGGGFRVEAKYGVTRYADRDVIGSGLDAVENNRVRELRLQLHWSL